MSQLQRLYNTAFKRGFILEPLNIRALLENRSAQLFKQIANNPIHILHDLIPSKRSSTRPLRNVNSVYMSRYSFDAPRTERYKQSFFQKHMFL